VTVILETRGNGNFEPGVTAGLSQLNGSLAHTLNSIYTLYGMWQILEHKRLDRRFKSLPLEVLKRYEKWKDIVSISGPDGLRAIRGFNDEALRGQWKGFRSSRLGLKYRLIYKIEATKVLVKVIDLTPHDYRKK
jgi:addiction module RelE/StbE family toxin